MSKPPTTTILIIGRTLFEQIMKEKSDSNFEIRNLIINLLKLGYEIQPNVEILFYDQRSTTTPSAILRKIGKHTLYLKDIKGQFNRISDTLLDQRIRNLDFIIIDWSTAKFLDPIHDLFESLKHTIIEMKPIVFVPGILKENPKDIIDRIDTAKALPQRIQVQWGIGKADIVEVKLPSLKLPRDELCYYIYTVLKPHNFMFGGILDMRWTINSNTITDVHNLEYWRIQGQYDPLSNVIMFIIRQDQGFSWGGIEIIYNTSNLKIENGPQNRRHAYPLYNSRNTEPQNYYLIKYNEPTDNNVLTGNNGLSDNNVPTGGKRKNKSNIRKTKKISKSKKSKKNKKKIRKRKTTPFKKTNTNNWRSKKIIFK